MLSSKMGNGRYVQLAVAGKNGGQPQHAAAAAGADSMLHVRSSLLLHGKALAQIYVLHKHAF
jgi:hypothetical protein